MKTIFIIINIIALLIVLGISTYWVFFDKKGWKD